MFGMSKLPGVTNIQSRQRHIQSHITVCHIISKEKSLIFQTFFQNIHCCIKRIIGIPVSFLWSCKGCFINSIINVIKEPFIHLIDIFSEFFRIKIRCSFFVERFKIYFKIIGKPGVIVIYNFSCLCIDQSRYRCSSCVIIISFVISFT